MTRFVVQRTFPEGLRIPTNAVGAAICRELSLRNAEEGVSWIFTYLSVDRRTSFCIYDAPSEDAIHRASRVTGLPVDSITPVRVLDPYFVY